MAKRYAILPCNGLDKAVGPLSREVALAVVTAGRGEIICPVLLHRSPARYAEEIKALPVLVIDGCATSCASRLAREFQLEVEKKLQVQEAAKAAGVTIADSLSPAPEALAFCQKLAADLLDDRDSASAGLASVEFAPPGGYLSFNHDKFVFRVPGEGYFFNENDCWVQVSGNQARIGISDYMQQYLSDIMFFEPPSIGVTIEQFGEAGSVESGKAVFEIISPVSGKVVRVNQEAVEKPEIINEDPYGKGWIVQLELSIFSEDRILLLDGGQYFTVMKKKITASKG
jgi:glycine cleavage system H protein